MVMRYMVEYFRYREMEMVSRYLAFVNQFEKEPTYLEMEKIIDSVPNAKDWERAQNAFDDYFIKRQAYQQDKSDEKQPLLRPTSM